MSGVKLLDADAAIRAAAEPFDRTYAVTGVSSWRVAASIREHVGPLIEGLIERLEVSDGNAKNMATAADGVITRLQARVRELEAEVALMRQRRDEYIAASNRDLEARRAAERQLAEARGVASYARHGSGCFVNEFGDEGDCDCGLKSAREKGGAA